MKITVFDTETTGLVQCYNQDNHDRITEICMLQYNENWNLIKEYNSLVKSPKEISKEVQFLTHISNEDIQNAEPFEKHFDKIMEFDDTDILIGQNVHYDLNMFRIEFSHLNKNFDTEFLKDKIICDTTVLKKVVRNSSYSQTKLYSYYFPERQLYKAHRAKDDVLALVEIIKRAIENEDIKL